MNAAVTGYEAGNFARDEKVKVRRPKRRRAQNLNPRVGNIPLTEGEFFNGDVTLERLWFDGFPIYGSDPTQSLQLYIQETGAQLGDSIMSPNEDYLYNKFRTYSATTGAQALGAHAPIRLTASIDGDGELTDFGDESLRFAGTVLDGFEVPDDNRYAILSTTAKGSFLGDTTLIDGFAAGLNLQSGRLIQTGVPNGQFVERRQFQTTGSTSVSGQVTENMLGNAAVGEITAAAANTDFTYADLPTGSNSVGAIDLTIDATGTTIGGNVAVGQIMKASATGHTYFGVILRIDVSTPTAPVITTVLQDKRGNIIDAATATAVIAAVTLNGSVPTIPSISPAFHQEALLVANRSIREPSPGSGATGTTFVDRQSNTLIQLFRGSYNLETVSEGQAAYLLTGSLLSDVRKTCLMLSK